MAKIDEGRYGLPEDCGFIPMDNLIDLAPTPDEFMKTAQAWDALAKVKVVTDGSVFSFRGPLLEKLAAIMPTTFLSMDDAVFLAACLGIDPTEAKQKLAHARKTSGSAVLDARPVTTFKEKVASARKSAARVLSNFPDIRASLLKEAAPIDDPTAVDKILSVGFLTPENVSIFSSYIAMSVTAPGMRWHRDAPTPVGATP